jgi:sec-independent protein translocase protein TatA
VGWGGPQPTTEGSAVFVFAEIIGWELLVVLALVALLFGGSKLPHLARSLGSAKREFEQGLHDSDDT